MAQDFLCERSRQKLCMDFSHTQDAIARIQHSQDQFWNDAAPHTMSPFAQAAL